MAAPIIINQTTRPGIIWSARKAPDINSLLLMNTDLSATVLVGSDLTSLVVPIGPNGSLSVDPSENWYAVWSTTGGKPLVIVPNGQSNFLGLTQGLGNLAIPSIRSPNFVTGVSGWTINQDGSAEFNNLVIRGNSVFPNGWLSNGDGTYTDTPGLFIYSSTPAAGNLILSICPNIALGHDKFNNAFLGNVTEYDNGNFVAFNTIAGAMQWFTMTAQPNATFTGRLSLAADVGNSARDLIIGNDQSVFTSNLGLDPVQGLLLFQAGTDSNTYRVGKFNQSNNSGQLVNAVAFTAYKTFNVANGVRYRITGLISIAGNQAAGNAVIGWAHGSTAGIGFWTGEANFNLGAALQVTHAAGYPIDASLALSTGHQIYQIDANVLCNGTGTIICSVACSIAADTWNVENGSWLQIEPVG